MTTRTFDPMTPIPQPTKHATSSPVKDDYNLDKLVTNLQALADQMADEASTANASPRVIAAALDAAIENLLWLVRGASITTKIAEEDQGWDVVDMPSTAELAIDAALWNALADRVFQRTGRRALFSIRDKAARIAVMALDAATDEWLVGYETRCPEQYNNEAMWRAPE